MKLSKLTFAVATALTASVTTSAFALDLYVDAKTKQIYAEPGANRVKLGSFEQINPNGHKGVDDFADAATRLHHENEKIHTDLELQHNEIKALEEKTAEASSRPIVSMDKKGLQVQSADKNFKFKFGGRIHADASFSDGDTDYYSKGAQVDSNDGTEFRRVRMRMEGVFYKDWLFRTEADFAGNGVAVKDAYIQYLGSKWATITVGQQKQNFSRELQESSNDMMFTERSLMNILNDGTVDRAIGLNFEHFGKNYVAKAGVFGDSVAAPSNTLGPDEGWGISSRLTYAPIMEKTKLVHLGIAGNYRQPADNQDVAKSKTLKYAYKTTNMSGYDPVNMAVTDVNDISMLGLEGGAIYGPFSVGGEYTHTWIDRKNGKDSLSLDGWYADAGYSLTGESRTYKNGNFTYLKPSKPFGKGGWGAWELAARYSEANLNDGTFKGGDISNVTVALNWYVNDNIRFMADYMRVLDVKNSVYKTSTGADMDGMNTYMLRGQLAF